MSARRRGSSNDRDDTHERYTTSLAKRQEQASAVYRAQIRDLSRSSSSSGSVSARSLRRTSRFEDTPPKPHVRSASLDSTALPRRSHSTASRPAATHHRTASLYVGKYTPHPALRISPRTHSAILYALEEALRKPHTLTSDDAEESAQMADLGGGGPARASNGGARFGGPVPVSRGTPPGIRTPRDIIRERNAREARRQEEQQEEQRRVEEEEGRRRSADRRAAATLGAAAPRISNTSSQYSPDVSARNSGYDGAGDRRSQRATGSVADAEALGQPTSRTGPEYSNGNRPRGSSASQPNPSRQPQVPLTAGARRTQPTQSTRQPAQAATTSGAAPSTSTQPAPTAAATTAGSSRQLPASFPHAFERWETLSSHWEGLTSYWLHKLEQNTDEIRETVPTASTLSRQITDLSAAGANLFHAVVELQRLRASSERKFQRWFFETRADNERHRELQAELERQLKVERSAKDEFAQSRAKDSSTVENARHEVMEMRRELMISKDEARRAWEELGRRNQESLDTAQSLKEGRITVVAGVQVVPYTGQYSHTGSVSQRPVTGDSQHGYGSTGMSSVAGMAGYNTGDGRQYYRDGPSPTNTDPFTDMGRQQPSILQELGSQPLPAGSYRPGGSVPISSVNASSSAPMEYLQRGAQSSSMAGGRGDPERFYQHGGSDALLHSPPQSSSQSATAAARTAPLMRDEGRSEASYPDTLSEGGTEYAIDGAGNIRRDPQGRPIIFPRRDPQPRSSESEADLSPDDVLRREREIAARYASQPLPEAPSVPSTSAAAMANYSTPPPPAPPPPQPTGSSAAQQQPPTDPDYEGAGYDTWEDRVRTTTHHHPTRLSDVLEEEEERSSRRTAE